MGLSRDNPCSVGAKQRHLGGGRRARCILAMTVVLPILASCDMAGGGDFMTGEGPLHRTVRSLCALHQSEIFQEGMTQEQIRYASMLCRTYGFLFPQP